MGQNPFSSKPQWTIGGTLLSVDDTLIYLGTVIGDKNGEAHCASRRRAAGHSFYALQGAGIKFTRVWPSVAIDCVASVFITRSQLQIMDKYQNKLIKQCLGVCQRTHSTPLLKSLGIETLSNSVEKYSIDLLKSNIMNSSICNRFYCMLMCSPELDTFTSKTLFGRDKSFCQHHNIMVKYMLYQGYVNFIKPRFKKEQIIKSGTALEDYLPVNMITLAEC